MKKLTLAAAILSLAGLSAFAQSQVAFNGTGNTSTRLVWDDYTVLAPKPDASNNVAFLWTTSLSATPLIDTVSGATSTATNGTQLPGGINAAQAWTAILTDPNFKLGTNGSSTAVSITSGVGNWTYNAGNSFTLVGAPASGNILVFVIGWANIYANPVLAAAAGSPIGWSQAFTYTIPTGTSAPPNFSGATTLDTLKFGVMPVPEPTTLALLGLGSASLMIFRRRKS